jgi:hypothetical protein
MTIGRFRDRSGLVTRRRVIAYLQREKRQNDKNNQFSKINYYVVDDDGVFLKDDDGYYIIDSSDQPSASLI